MGSNWEVIVKGYGVVISFWLNENILKLMMVMVAQSVTILKTAELYTLSYMSYILIKLLKNLKELEAGSSCWR